MIDGYVHPRFSALAARFETMYGKPKDGGGALSAYVDGELVLDVWAGFADSKARKPWQRDTMALTFSTSKGVASTLLHILLERAGTSYDAPVASIWPEFAQADKDTITLRELLSHSAGLHDVRNTTGGMADLLDHRRMAELLAARPASPARLRAPGYHGFTYGWLVAALIERLSGLDARDALRKELTEPLDLDGLFFGAPIDERHRIATLFPRLAPGGMSIDKLAVRVEKWERTRGFAEALLIDGTEGLMMNDDRMLDTLMPAVNGVFTARSLAKMYGALANEGSVEGVRILRPDTVHTIGRVQRRERDYVLGLPMKWRLGYHRAFTSGTKQPVQAFGHFGFGGSGAWADPESGMSLAFVTNRMGTATTPVGDARLARLGATALKLARSV